VISLGTTSQDGNMRQVKVEVLGVMDPESKLIRLRAVEPLQVIPSVTFRSDE
jgi:ribosomal protein S28E/S33